MRYIVLLLALAISLMSVANAKVLPSLYRDGDTWKYAVGVLDPTDLQTIPLRIGNNTWLATVTYYEDGMTCETCLRNGVVFKSLSYDTAPTELKKCAPYPKYIVSYTGTDEVQCFDCFRKHWYEFVQSIK